MWVTSGSCMSPVDASPRRLPPNAIEVRDPLTGGRGAQACQAGVVVALTAQRSLSSQSKASALSALEALSTSASPASLQTALGRLTATAQTVGGAAGAYLAAGERLLGASLPDVAP